MLSIRNFLCTNADKVITNSDVLTSSGLSSPIAANQTQKLQCWLPITVDSAGGVKVQVLPPVGSIAYVASIVLYDTVDDDVTPIVQGASAPFGVALSNAGSHWIAIECYVANGAVAGVVDVLIAQNSANAGPLTLSRGASLQVDIL